MRVGLSPRFTGSELPGPVAKTNLGLSSPVQFPPYFGPELAAHGCYASLGQRPSPELKVCPKSLGPAVCMGGAGSVQGGRCGGIQGKASR